MSIQDQAPSPIYSAEFTYRRPVILILAILLIVGGTALGVWSVMANLEGHIHPRQRPGMFVSMFCFLMAFIGLFGLGRFVSGKRVGLEIDLRGIRHGRRFYAWEEIQSLHGRVEMTPIRLVLRTKGWLPVDVYLPTDDGLTDAEYEALMCELQKEVAPRFPHLSFWPE